MCTSCSVDECSAKEHCPIRDGNEKPEESYVICDECGRTLRKGEKYIAYDGFIMCLTCLHKSIRMDGRCENCGSKGETGQVYYDFANGEILCADCLGECKKWAN